MNRLPVVRAEMRQTVLCCALSSVSAGLLLGTLHAQSADRVATPPDVTTRVVLRESATSQSADRGTLRPGESAELLGSVPNEKSAVVRLDLGDMRVLLMGNSEAGGRNAPTVAPVVKSIAGVLLACRQQQLAADVLIAAHHGSRTSSRKTFLDGAMATTCVVSSGPTKYNSVVLPDADILSELLPRGQVFRTDLTDATTCKQNPTKIGPDADNQPGGCDNVRILVAPGGTVQAAYWHGSE